MTFCHYRSQQFKRKLSPYILCWFCEMELKSGGLNKQEVHRAVQVIISLARSIHSIFFFSRRKLSAKNSCCDGCAITIKNKCSFAEAIVSTNFISMPFVRKKGKWIWSIFFHTNQCIQKFSHTELQRSSQAYFHNNC